MLGADEAAVTDLPKEFAIESVFPNPFNPVTSVAIALPEQGELRVSVFNALGQEVAVLADGSFKAGYERFTFNASGFASGIYFVRADLAGERHQLKKIVLMK